MSSSPSSTIVQLNRPKFTKGEKCIFTHIIATFVIIIVIIIIYFIHLCLVKHTRNDSYKITRRAYEHSWIQHVGKTDYQYVGMVYINMSMQVVVCNVLLLHKYWSLGPGQCSSMRDDPNLSDYLPLWKIKYKIMEEYINSNLKRTLTHSRFNRGDFDNNIGLFQHKEEILGQYYVAPNDLILNDYQFQKHSKNMFLLNWEIVLSQKGDISDAVVYLVSPMVLSMCTAHVIPVVESLRSYEFCVTLANKGLQRTVDHGAVFVMDSKVIGFFSWGDKSGKSVPFVILNISHFRKWFEIIIGE